MSKLITEITQEKIEKIQSDAWLNVIVNDNTIANPLEIIPELYQDSPQLFFTYMMSRPEYFSLLCKEILNIDLFPFQSVILREMWTHKFPMLVAARGASKCITYNTKVITNQGIKNIGDIVNSEEEMKRVYKEGLSVYTENHTWEEVEYGWCNGTTETVKIELENGFEIECTLNHPLRVKKNKKNVWVDGGDIKIGDTIPLISPSESIKTRIVSNRYISVLAQLSFCSNSVPNSIWDLQKEQVLLYLDKLATFQENPKRIKSLSKKFVQDLQLVYFYKTGLSSTIKRNADGLYSLALKQKVLLESKVVSVTKSKAKTYDIHMKKDHSFISNGFISHNSFTLGLYALMRAILIPGRKIIIVGSVFRQSKVIFNYLTKMYENAPLLRDANPGKGPKMFPDRCELQIGDSLITALPIGCLSTDTLITTQNGIREMGDYSINNFPSEIWSVDKYKDVGFFYDNGIHNCKKIITEQGYEYIGTPNHKMKVVRNNKIQWVRSDEMVVGDSILIDSSERWYEPTFKATDEQGYALGCMIGDGSYVRKNRLQFTTQDEEFIPRLSCIGEFKKQKDNLHYYMCKTELTQNWLNFWGLDLTYTKDKKLPNNLLSSPKNVVANCLAGIFDTDGHVYTSDAKGGTSISINYTTISQKLARQIQYILLHFGIRSSLRSRKRKQILRGVESKTQRVYELMISGPDVVRFYANIPIKLERKKKQLEEALAKKTKFNAIKKDYVPVDKKLLIEIAQEYNLGHRLHVKDIERKKTVTKHYLSKFLKKCLELNIKHDNIEIFQELLQDSISYCKIKEISDVESVYTVDLNVPEDNTYTANGFVSHNTGESIRGYRSNDTICDEFAAQSQEIFETVIAGFGSVSQSPVENAKEAAALKLLKALNLPSQEIKKDEFNKDNQIILTGSAYYYFNHFAQYWEKWKNIIYSQGKQDKLMEIFRGEIPEGFRWDDYSILRLPVELLPPGFMDEGQIARSKATMTSSIYEMEFSAVFSKDSDGFFKASSIDSATANKDNNIIFPPNEDPVIFDPKVKGDPGKKYVMGIDPASEVDNFSIVILELNKTHNRIVYCWTTNSKKFKRKLQKGLIDNRDYYGFCARKIRNLLKDFNIEHIAMDAQGGGKAVYEAFQDDKNFKEGEMALLEIIEAGKKKDSDGEVGLHIIEMVQFANYDYISSANHNLKKDIEDKVLLFPRYSPSLLALSGINDEEEDLEDTSIYDTLEDCIIEIQELKSELAQIVVTSTPSGRERWDTPEVKVSGTKKGRARKDRYSSLLIANAAARKIFRGEVDNDGITQKLDQTSNKEPGFIGPSWATKALEDLYS